jgi:hypothetical protein
VFPKIVNFVKKTLFAKKPGCAKVTCFSATDNEFPQELKTVRFNFEPKRCKSVSLSAKRSVSSLVGLAHGVVTEKLRFPYKFLIKDSASMSSQKKVRGLMKEGPLVQMLDRQRVQQAAADEAKKLVDAAALASERLVDATKEAEETATAAAAAAAAAALSAPEEAQVTA